VLLSAPNGPGGAAQPDTAGRRSEPGGWNRIQLEVDDLNQEVDRLRVGGAGFRTDVIAGQGRRQVLIENRPGT
jgi:hypothetical protein